MENIIQTILIDLSAQGIIAFVLAVILMIIGYRETNTKDSSVPCEKCKCLIYKYYKELEVTEQGEPVGYIKKK